MNEPDYEQLTLFPADSPASPSVWLESKREKGTTVTYGRRCSELSGSLRRVGSSVRTYLESCALPPGTWSRTWSVKALTSSCLILKLRLSERGTDASGSRLSDIKGLSKTEKWRIGIENAEGQPRIWKTPVAADAANREFYHNSRGEPNLSGMVKLWPTPTARDYKGANSMEHLTRESGNRNHADQLANAVKMFPTPMARDYKSPDLNPESNRFQQKTELNSVIGDQLNPDWVEWLMGFPIGWTSLPECRE